MKMKEFVVIAMAMFSCNAMAEARKITIDNVTYGREGVNVIELTDNVAKLCNDKKSCSFKVTLKTLNTADPAPDVTKELTITWSCGDEGMPVQTRNDYATVKLSCK